MKMGRGIIHSLQIESRFADNCWGQEVGDLNKADGLDLN